MSENKLNIKKRPLNINLKIRDPNDIKKVEYVFGKILNLQKKLGKVKDYAKLDNTKLTMIGFDILFDYFTNKDFKFLEQMQEQKKELMIDKLKLLEH